MTKTLLSLSILLLAELIGSAQGLKYSQYPTVTSLNNRYLLLVADPGITNYAILWSDLIRQIGTNGQVIITTNVYITYITNTTLITTNVTINAGGGLTNLNLTPLSVMASDPNDAESSIANHPGVLTNSSSGPASFGLLGNFDMQHSSISVSDGAGIGISGSPVSLGGTLIGSAISATPQFSGMYLTGQADGPTFQPNTNAMASATNTLSFANSDYTFVSLTAVSVTGFAALPTTNSANICVTLVNTSGTNWNCTFPLSVLADDGVRGSTTVTNGQQKIFWFRYNAGTGCTNKVSCPNY